jgi:hypothetical protein
MYVYIQSERGDHPLWTVGHYDPDGKWIAESDHQDPEKAAERVAYLNGGRAVNAALGEALNSGDGSYRP